MARKAMDNREAIDELRNIGYDIVENIQRLATNLLKQAAVLELRLRQVQCGMVDYMEEHSDESKGKAVREVQDAAAQQAGVQSRSTVDGSATSSDADQGNG